MGKIIRFRGDRHRQTQEALPWYVTDQLDDGERADVETHLADCEACRRELEAERDLARQVVDLPLNADASWEAVRRRMRPRGPSSKLRSLADALQRAFARPTRLGWVVAAQALVLAGSAACGWAQAQSASSGFWPLLRQGGCVVLMRHAQTESGVGDPPGFTLGRCETQRNLSSAGRAQAARVGDAFRREDIAIASVRSSAWCRCTDTARLAFGRYTVWPAINSFFQGQGDHGARPGQGVVGEHGREQSQEDGRESHHSPGGDGVSEQWNPKAGWQIAVPAGRDQKHRGHREGEEDVGGHPGHPEDRRERDRIGGQQSLTDQADGDRRE